MRCRIDWWKIHDAALDAATYASYLVISFFFTGFIGLLFSDTVLEIGACIGCLGTVVMFACVGVAAFAKWMAIPRQR